MSVRVKKVSLAGEDQSILEHYFNQITGDEAPDIDIIQPKADELIGLLARSRQYLCTFASVLCADTSMPWAGDMDGFVARIDSIVDAIKEAGASGQLADQWAELKTAEPVNMLIESCANLGPIRAHLGSSWAEADRGFMTRFSGLTFEPFPWSKLDIKHLWVADDSEDGQMRELIYVILSGICSTAHAIYDVVTRPDVDIGAVSRTIVKSLGNLRKQPGLSRCEHAFRKIEESVTLLETNFTDYFRDYVETDGSKASIFVRFLGDVSEKSDKKDPLLIMQLRQIVNFYSKNAAEQSKKGGQQSAKFKRFEALMQSYNSLEKKAISAVGMPIPEADTNAELDSAISTASGSAADQPPGPVADERDIDSLMRAINDPNKKTVDSKRTSSVKNKKAKPPTLAA